MVSPIDRTLRALVRHKMIVEVKCGGCGHIQLFDPAWLAQHRNPLSDFARLPFRCSTCGLKCSEVRAFPDEWQNPGGGAESPGPRGVIPGGE